MTDIIVSGAEYSAANGTYVYSYLDLWGYPVYVHENIFSYFAAWGGDGDERWYIYDAAEFAFLYYCAENVATPDLCSSWTDGLTETPSALTVTAAGGSAQNLTLTCAAGSYSLTGTAATLTYTPAAQNLTLSCGAGSLALTGSNATFEVKRNFVLSCSAGSYAVTGTAATFTVLRNYTLALGTGSYTLTGTDADLLAQYHYSLACNSGSYLLTGTPTSLTSARTLACNSGAYTLTGLEADLFKRLVMPCGNGSYILTGSPATINSARTFVLGMGSYVLVGTNAGLYKYVQFPYAEIWDGKVVMNLGISENIRLNKEVNKNAVMNRELDFTYSELESTL